MAFYRKVAREGLPPADWGLGERGIKARGLIGGLNRGYLVGILRVDYKPMKREFTIDSLT
jgi:hypothetical protein